MLQYLAKAVGWVVLATAFILLPITLTFTGELPDGRGFWVDFAAVLGFIALAVMALQFVLTGRFPRVGKPFGVDTLLYFHRQLGILGLFFVLGHVVIIVAADPAYLAFLDPRVELPRALALNTVLLALALLVATSVWRTRFALSYEIWRLLHAGMAALVLFIGLAHLIMVDHFTATLPKKGIWVAVCLLAFAWLTYIRLIKPLRARRTPWRVATVERIAPETWSLRLAAVDHGGLRFQAGHYAWLTLGKSPFSLQQHPFTISSSPSNPREIEFTIKELGDFTSNIGSVEQGTRAFLEGPYGHFTLRAKAPATVFVAGGIGVTPAISILRWMRDTRSRHFFYLFYAVEHEPDLAFREELDALREQLNLRVIYVLESPPNGWTGETGMITTNLLARHLPEPDRRDYDYMTCGPNAMADAVGKSLQDFKIPLRRQRDERFDMV